MNRSIEYTQAMSNFDSVYNVSPTLIHQSTKYTPMSSLITSSMFSNRSSSPLFRRCKSPPLSRPILSGSGPKFNFDLYKMDQNNDEFDKDSLSSYRSLSPTSSRIIYHHPIHSSRLSPISKPQALSKLQQINDELCQTLAQSELTDRSPAHYHIHHYPLSQHSHEKYRSRSISEERSESTELEVSPRIHKARVTYKIHIPRRHQQSSRHRSAADVYSSDNPMFIDLYPTRDQGFVKQIRKKPDNQSPWIIDGSSIRRNSYSDSNTSQLSETPRGPYYGDKPIKSRRRSVRAKERPSSSSRYRSPSVTSGNRPDSAPFHVSDEYQESNASFSNTVPIRQQNGSIKQSKFIDSHIPSSKSKSSRQETSRNSADVTHKRRHSRTYDPHNESSSSRTRKPIWHPPSKTISEKSPKYFEPTLKSKYDVPTGKHITDGTESEPISQRKTLSDRTKIRNGDSNLKKHITNADSKVKSAWEPTVDGLSKSTVKEPKPSTTTNTDQNSLHNESIKPTTKPISKNQSIVDKNDDNVQDSSENESTTSERSKNQDSSRPPPRIEKPPTPQQPRKPSTELPKTTNGALKRRDDANNIHDENQTPLPTADVNNNKKTDNDNGEKSDAQNEQPTSPPHSSHKIPTSEHKTPSPKPTNKNDKLTSDDDRDENDDEVANSFDVNKWLDDASKAILGPSRKDDTVIPSQPLPKPKVKSPPRRKEPSPSRSPEVSDEDLYNPPFGPKRKNQQPSIPLPPPPQPPPPPPPTTTTTTGETNEVDDFFN
ncbi:unnamed protein product [Rotaria sordida]|uniref:Uncharacterized protein n=1 Tax=Rotaria sordida TaxID=392033 RepID=A0A814PAE0_9BILA|nr:unnamed protein product [Rotaria sordida]